MMRRIIALSLRFRFLVLAAAAGMMIFGASQVRAMPVDVFPEFAPPKVEIQTICVGLSAEEVENLVTVPLEQALAGIDGLDIIRSKSVIQLSQIELIFKPGTDLLRARQLVAERVAEVTPTLPTWAAPPFMIQPLSATSRFLKVGMTSDEVSLIDMSMISYWTIRPRLLSVPGVANVQIWGERLDMPQVRVVPAKLAEHGVAMTDVMEAVSEALDEGILQLQPGNFTGTGGYVDTPEPAAQRPPRPAGHRRGRPRPRDRHRRDGDEVPITEVAELVRDHQPLIGDAVINDGPGILLIIEKFPWANTLDVTRGVDQAFQELEPGLAGITIDRAIFRPASFIDQALGQPVERAASRQHPRLRRPHRVPVRLADRADQPRRDPAVAHGRGDGAVRARRDDQHDDPRRASSSRWGSSSMTRSSTSRTSRDDSASTAWPEATDRPRRSSSSRRSKSAARSSTRRSSTSSRSRPVFFIEGLSGAFFQPLVISYGAGRPCLAAGRPDGDAGHGLPPAPQRPDRAPAVADLAMASGRLWAG